MALPKFWYTRGDGVVTSVEITEGLSDLDENPVTLRADGQSAYGGLQTTHHRTVLHPRVVVERFSGLSSAGKTLHRKLMTLHYFLAIGNGVAFARDPDKAWGGYASSLPAAGDTVIRTNGNTFAYNASAALAAGDEVVVQGPPDSGKVQHTTISTILGNTMTLSHALVFDYSTEEYCLVRQRDFFPVLRMAPGDARRTITSERRIVYTFECDFIEDVASLSTMSTKGSYTVKAEDAESDRGLTITKFVDEAASGGRPDVHHRGTGGRKR